MHPTLQGFLMEKNAPQANLIKENAPQARFFD